MANASSFSNSFGVNFLFSLYDFSIRSNAFLSFNISSFIFRARGVRMRINNSFLYFCFYLGLAHTTGVKSSILNGISVFVAILVASLIFKQEKLTLVKLFGSVFLNLTV